MPPSVTPPPPGERCDSPASAAAGGTSRSPAPRFEASAGQGWASPAAIHESTRRDAAFSGV